MAESQYSSTAMLAKNWLPFLLTGALSLVLGLVAIAGPYILTSAINLLFGGLLLVAGLSEIVRAVRQRGQDGWWWPMVLGGFYAAGGFILLFIQPAGILALTVVLSVTFLVKGAAVIVYAIRWRALRSWRWLALSGLASIVIAVLIWIGWPANEAWSVGLLAGIELTLFGAALILVAFEARKAR